MTRYILPEPLLWWYLERPGERMPVFKGDLNTYVASSTNSRQYQSLIDDIESNQLTSGVEQFPVKGGGGRDTATLSRKEQEKLANKPNAYKSGNWHQKNSGGELVGLMHSTRGAHTVHVVVVYQWLPRPGGTLHIWGVGHHGKSNSEYTIRWYTGEENTFSRS
jgi:hypothetical protein